MQKIEWHDVQGIVRRGYGHLPVCAYVPFAWTDTRAARDWLRRLAPRLMRADRRGTEDERLPHAGQIMKDGEGVTHALNIALTASGLRPLIGEELLQRFSIEFREGMAPGPNARRSNVLGDLEQSSPKHWIWGGWSNPVDGILLLFAFDDATLQSELASELADLNAVARTFVDPGTGGPLVLNGWMDNKTKREHFGFRDGISQPVIIEDIEGHRAHTHRGKVVDGKAFDVKEKEAETRRIHGVRAGEFIFGYYNERKVRVGAEDLRRNGSFLVLRQLEQDVPAYLDLVKTAAELLPWGATRQQKEEWIAARLVGRNYKGEALASPSDGNAEPEPWPLENNNFLFERSDHSGLRCPVGAHMRRANPRDSRGPNPEIALQLSKMHRILRRGRMYGERCDPASPDQGGPRGLLFAALNADLAGQFEMIQHSWLNNRHFGEMHLGTDPLGHVAEVDDVIVIPARPVNIVLPRPRPLVTVRGGAYFFLPGIEAVQTLAMSRP